MASPPPASVPSISPAEIQILISRAGLVLNPGQVADLVLAWRQVAGLIASIPRDRALADDMALAFRLPPPEPIAAAARTRAKAPVRPATAKPAQAKPRVAAASKPKAAAKPAAKAPRKAAAKKTAPMRAAPAKAGRKSASPKALAKAPAKGRRR